MKHREPSDVHITSSSSSEAATKGAGQAAPNGIVSRINRAINGTIERAFNQLGRFVGRRPFLVIILSVLVACALGVGVIRLENEERGDKLWVPKNTQSEKDSEIVEGLFPDFGRFQSWRMQRTDEQNILTPAAFDEALAIHNGYQQNVTWENDGNFPWLPATVGFTDVCLARDGTRFADSADMCIQSDVLAIFSYDPANWATQEAIRARLNAPAQWDRSVVGQGFVLSGALSGIERDAAGTVVGARALTFSFFLVGNSTLDEQQERDDSVYGWEQEWLDFMETEDEDRPAYTIARFAGRSFDDEFGDTIAGDLALLQGAIIGITIFTVIALSNCRDGFVGQRKSLTVGGLLNIGLAIFASYGFGSWVGLLFSPLMSVLPFILLGIGVDGIFVLQAALDKTDPAADIVDRMGYTLSHAGVSVTVASLTNFAAFIIGSNTSLPALSAFSIYAALSILFDLLLQVTFFAALMTLNARREAARRLDVFCCAKSSAPVDQGAFCGACGPGRPRRPPSTFVMEKVALALSKKPVKAVVVVAWLALLAVGITGTVQIDVEGDVNNFIPDGSYLNTYLELGGGSIGAGTPVELYFVNTDDAPAVDFAAPAVGEQMLGAIETLQGSQYTKEGTFDAWYPAFLDFVGAAAPAGAPAAPAFYTQLQAFLDGPGARYAGDVVFYDDANPAEGIEAHRFKYEWIYFPDTADEVKALDETRDLVDTIPAPLGAVAFAYGDLFLNVEQYKTIGREAFMNISLAFAMIAVIVIFLLASPVGSLITFACVASAIVELVGIMYFIGFRIDSVVVIFLVISLGLAVDYSVHVAHGFLAARDASMEARLKACLIDTGAPVINGATSTLIAAVFLAASGSYVFETFFYALLVVVLAGAFQGLIVLPVLMSIFAPAPHVDVLEGEGHKILKRDAPAAPDAAHAAPAAPV